MLVGMGNMRQASLHTVLALIASSAARGGPQQQSEFQVITANPQMVAETGVPDFP
jgi:hypothetical protein